MATVLAQRPAADTFREAEELRLGIAGAGKLGTTIARTAVAAGYDVAVSGSGSAEDIALTVDVLAPGARAVTTDEVVRHAEIVVLAVPIHRFRELPRDLFAGKIVIDALLGARRRRRCSTRRGSRRHQRHRPSALPFRASGQEPQPARLEAAGERRRRVACRR